MSGKITIVLPGGLAACTEEQKIQLLGEIRNQLGSDDLEWDDIEVVDDPDIVKTVTGIMKEDADNLESQDPYQKYWDELALRELLGEPRVLH